MGHGPERRDRKGAGTDYLMNFSIQYIIKRKDDTFDYNDFAFKVMAADVMDMDNSEDILIILKTLIMGGAKKVCIDMNGLVFIDSSGISVIIEAAKLLRQYKGDMVLVNVPEGIQKIFQPIKLNRFMKIFDNDDEAIGFLKLI
jgi:anti-anti-sigma factor